jgi:hypothetical protein
MTKIVTDSPGPREFSDSLHIGTPIDGTASGSDCGSAPTGVSPAQTLGAQLVPVSRTSNAVPFP